MKRPKDRLYRVIVIGATPAGIAATNKLGELGIPVTLVDSDFDLDKKLSREEWKLKNGMTLNYAHRSGLIRIFRNPVIQCVLPAKITSIKHTHQGFRAKLSNMQTCINPDKCILCGKCVKACPATTFEGDKALKLNSRRSLPGRVVIDKRETPLCQENCPLGVNAQGYITLAKEGEFEKALALIRENNVLPGICGRICTHPCENECRRGELDEPLAIRDIKRFVADHEYACDGKENLYRDSKPEAPTKKEKIAVIGAGPAGIAAAADLAKNGFEVTVFEKEKSAGGLLRYGIGPHRLPRNILDIELKFIEKLGVKIKTSSPIRIDKDVGRLKKDFDAVILSTGTWADIRLGVPGEDLEGVHGCLAFLNDFYRGKIKRVEEKVAVIGDGNAAFDMARTLVRIGADVTILSWFPEDLIPADPEEIKAAQEEGVLIKSSFKTVEFAGKKGKLQRILLKPTRPGEPDKNGIPWPVIIPDGERQELEFDRAFVAIGQKSPLKKDSKKGNINITGQGYFEVDDTLHTSAKKIYAAGDAVSGPSSVVEAMAQGRKVARSVCQDFYPKEDWGSYLNVQALRPEDRTYPDIPEDIPTQARPTMSGKRPAVRKKGFDEVIMGLNESQVVFEAQRCLQCGVCSECFECIEACGAIGAVDHAQPCEDTIEQAGVVIIADPTIAPSVRGEDVIRAYGPKAAKPDVDAMILRGFAAAAQAVILLGGASMRSKGHGISFSPPDPGLSPEIRIGIFVCKCNDSMGWLESMGTYIEKLKSNTENVVFTEVLDAACVPEGSSGIAKAVRENGITRVVLASCVCCPLNFICSACTEQRSRLKNALFTGTGISPSMVETCNLRGEVLSFVEKEPDIAFSRFSGLIDRSIRRASKLILFPTPARTYNFATAVVGESEATMSSALTLADSGQEVFLFGTLEKPLAETTPHPNIHAFKGSSVKAISGTLGDFHVFVELDGFEQSLQVGTVILGEKSRKITPYIHQEGLPSCIVTSARQKEGLVGIPFFYPGATPIPGLYLADPPGINLSNRKKGAAAAIQATALMPRGPRQSKGFTVVVDKNLCRGCGRCFKACSYQAVTLEKNDIGGWYATVDEALCKGCGNCISVCPSNAADSPYRNMAFLEQALEEVLGQ
jgi:NADPH-dependent glutamate synthase beta subunit-like oxidoreductase/NAD-dependent dihydropyrimidine dehydrogenase PreA subunit